MSDDGWGTTNPARAARESKRRLRGELPPATPGSAAEAMGYGTVIEPEPRTTWLGRRRAGIGSADIRIIMGWGFSDESLYRLWAEKVGLLPLETEDREVFEFGRRAEPMLQQWFEDETGLWVENAQSHRVSPALEWAMATIDGEVFESPVMTDEREPLGGVEFKTTRDSVRSWEENGPPVRYMAQCQWQMFVCNWPQVWLAVLHGTAFRIYEIVRDPDDISLIVAAAAKFWHEHVEAVFAPSIDGSSSTSTALRDIYRGKAGETIELDLAMTARQLREAKRMRDQWAESATQLENEIKAAMGDATFATLGDGFSASWSRFDQTRVDSKLLAAEYPDAFEACKKVSPTGRFTLKETD